MDTIKWIKNIEHENRGSINVQYENLTSDEFGNTYLIKSSKKGNYKNGLQEDFWEYNVELIDENKIQKYLLKGKYIEGKEDGIWELYFGGGGASETINIQLDTIYFFNKGLLEGNQHSLWNTASYKNGVLDGEYKMYYDNGNIIVKGEYHNGQREGIWISYDYNGNILTQEKYQNGKLIMANDHDKI